MADVNQNQPAENEVAASDICTSGETGNVDVDPIDSVAQIALSDPEQGEVAVEFGENGSEGMDNVVIVVYDEESAAAEASANDDRHTMSEEDLISIKNMIEERKRLQRDQQRQESFEEGDNMSQQSSMPSTPASFGDKVANFYPRRVRGRKKRAGAADGNATRSYNFLHYIAKRCGQRCLRRLLTPSDESDRLGDSDHCYFAFKTKEDSLTNDGALSSSHVLLTSKSGYYRPLFLSQYDASMVTSTASDTSVSQDVDVDVEDIETSKRSISENATSFEDTEMDEAFATFFEISLASFNELYAKAQELVASIGKTLRNGEEDTDASWKDELMKLVETSAQKKLIGRVLKLLDDVYYSTLAAAGHPDEWLMRQHSISRGSSFLRQHFADAIASGGTALLNWAHWFLMERLAPETCATYFLLLGELFYKAPDLVGSIINSEESSNMRVVELVTTFLADMRRSSVSSDLFFPQRPPPRLPKDPILMLVSSTIKAHSDNLARGSPRCHYFYKNLFPHIGFCMDVKFTPFKKGMTMASCADQLCAFLRDKIREVHYYHANRPIVLIGWQTSGLVALKIALEKSVAAVVCLGFPNLTLSGFRGGKGDDLLEIPCPTLFVVGQFAATCSIDDLENMRKNMRSERTGLVVVGGADDELQMSNTKLRSENLCQEVVDRCIMESVGEFLSATLETYTASSDAVSNTGSLPGGIAIKRDGEGSSPQVAKRRRSSVVGQLCSSVFSSRRLSTTKKPAKVKSKSSISKTASSSDMSTDDKVQGSSSAAPSADTSVTTKAGGDETNLSADDNSTSSFGATRTRQIRKPHLLDL